MVCLEFVSSISICLNQKTPLAVSQPLGATAFTEDDRSAAENTSDKSMHSPMWDNKPNLLPPSQKLAPLSELKHLDYAATAMAEGALEMEDEKKRDREHKKRSKNWTRPETLKLIQVRTELDPRFSKSGRKADLWEEIAYTLQKDSFFRDGQQCKDKWEKLTAGYKEVRDGFRDKEDNPYFNELHHLLSMRMRVGCERDKDEAAGKERTENGGEKKEVGNSQENHADLKMGTENVMENHEDWNEANGFPRKRRRDEAYISMADLSAVQKLLEDVISRQQIFFGDLLDAMDRKEQMRERMRQEREEKWRAEERAQRCVFNNAMIVLAQRLLGERLGAAVLAPLQPPISPVIMTEDGAQLGPKKRSKNWKRTEVLQLIKLRWEMDGKFAKSTRRAALWEDIAEKLLTQGIKRDGKQCREKWDKLMAEYKDVTDGKRDKGESPYFAELTAFAGKPVETATHNNSLITENSLGN